jgi:hypothetical protein
MGKHKLLLIITAIVGLAFLAGCKTTRYVPEGKYLLNDIDYQIDNKQINKDELSSYVRQEENLKILGFFKFHLWLYNISKKDKEKGWFKEIGEPPVIYDEMLKNKSVEQMRQYLYNKGYYNAKVSDNVVFRKKRAFVTYDVEANDPYLIRNISFSIKDTSILNIINDGQEETLIHQGDIFDVDVCDLERTRITRLLNDNGYFHFVADYIYFNIDSSLMSNQVDLEMVVSNPVDDSKPTVEGIHKRFYIDNYSVSVVGPQKSAGTIDFQNLKDSLRHDGIFYHFDKKIPIKASTIAKTLEVIPGQLYSRDNEERTYNNLYSIRQFKYVNIQFKEMEQYRDSLIGKLTGDIYLPMQIKQNYSVDVEGTTSGDFLGVALNLNYQHRNLFHGGEIFDFRIKGATERKTLDFVMNEISSEAKLSFPGLIIPGNERRLKLYSMPFTTISAALSFEERQQYTRTILNARFGYQWRSSEKLSHSLSLFDINSIDIYRIDPDWYDRLKNLFIKSSFTPHIISATSYSLVYNDQSSTKKPDYKYFRYNIELAGNALWLLSSATGRPTYDSNEASPEFNSTYYKLFNIRFAQYFKNDFEFRYGYRFDKYNLIATRGFFGVAYPYGNYPVTPPERVYYAGGANGIRAWPVRRLGPGSNISTDSLKIDQSGDIKLEANLEYRFKFFWMLEGALFVDAGNVWAINRNDNREGAVFQFNRFYKEIAVGSGVGLRLVTNYFILRTDVGIKLRDPSLPEGTRWIPGSRSYQWSDLNFNIAIGYPF